MNPGPCVCCARVLHCRSQPQHLLFVKHRFKARQWHLSASVSSPLNSSSITVLFGWKLKEVDACEMCRCLWRTLQGLWYHHWYCPPHVSVRWDGISIKVGIDPGSPSVNFFLIHLFIRFLFPSGDYIFAQGGSPSDMTRGAKLMTAHFRTYLLWSSAVCISKKAGLEGKMRIPTEIPLLSVNDVLLWISLLLLFPYFDCQRVAYV